MLTHEDGCNCPACTILLREAYEDPPDTEPTLPPCREQGCDESALYCYEHDGAEQHACLRHARLLHKAGVKVWVMPLEPVHEPRGMAEFESQLTELEGSELVEGLGGSGDLWPWDAPS